MSALRTYTAVDPKDRLKVWLERQSPQKQAAAADLGLDKPMNDQKTHAREFEENQSGVIESLHVPLNGEVLEIIDSSGRGRDETLRIIRFTFARLLESPTLPIECLCIAAGVIYGGDKEVDVAKRYGVTRACVSKLILANKQLLGNLGPTGPCRSKNVRRIYTNRAKAVHLSNEQSVHCNGHGRNSRGRK
jgi:hypothetical protein